jgi:hypothetical protein
MRFKVSPEDFLKGQLAEVGWHPSIVHSYEEKMSKPKDGGESSQYSEVQFKIVDGPSKGIVVYQNFSEKAPSFIVPLLEALGATIDRKKVYDGEISAANMKGKLVDIHVVRGTWNNKPKNEIDGYRAFSGRPAAPSSQPGV